MGKALPAAHILLDSESQSPMRQKTIGNQASLVLLPQNYLFNKIAIPGFLKKSTVL